MMYTIMQAAVEAVKGVFQAMTEKSCPTERRNGAGVATNMSARTSGPSMREPTFKWKVTDKYDELLNFEMKVKIFSLPRVMTSVTTGELWHL